ncbi:hypothetical protein Q5752_001483 [Cryptotrichosporon argae]
MSADGQPGPSSGAAPGPSHAKTTKKRVLTDARRQQNRLAQQTYRHRKDQRLAEAEDELERARAVNKELETQVQALKGIIVSSIQAGGAVSGPALDLANVDLDSLANLGSRPLPARPPAPPQSAHSWSRPFVPAPVSSSSATPGPASHSPVERPPLPASTSSASNTTVATPALSAFGDAALDIGMLDANPSWLADMFDSPAPAPTPASPEPGPGLWALGNSNRGRTDARTRAQADAAPDLAALAFLGPPVPGVWAAPAAFAPTPQPRASAKAEPQASPYSLDGLEFLWGWDSGSMSTARTDMQRLLDMPPGF